MADVSTAPAPNTATFQAGETASGVAARLGMTPAQFLSYNPELAATGRANDWQGLTGLVNIGQTYKTGPSSSQLAVSSVPSRLNDANNNSALNSALNSLGTTNAPLNPVDNSKDPILTSLATMHTNSDAATKSLLASTMATYQNKMNTVNQSYDKYKAGLESLGIEHNAAQGTPELLAGQIQSVANEQAGKISTIQADMAKALMNAKTASANSDFKTLNAEMTRYNQLNKQKQDAIKNMYDSINKGFTASVNDIKTYYSTLQTLDKADQETFLKALAKRDNLPLDGLASALADYAQTEEGKSLTIAQKTKTLNKASGSKASGGVSQAQIKQGQDILKTGKGPDGKVIGNPIGSDGFVDPGVYLALFNDWPGTTKQFLATYPPADYVNPAATNLPKYLMPKATRGSSGSGRSTTG